MKFGAKSKKLILLLTFTAVFNQTSIIICFPKNTNFSMFTWDGATNWTIVTICRMYFFGDALPRAVASIRLQGSRTEVLCIHALWWTVFRIPRTKISRVISSPCYTAISSWAAKLVFAVRAFHFIRATLYRTNRSCRAVLSI